MVGHVALNDGIWVRILVPQPSIKNRSSPPATLCKQSVALRAGNGPPRLADDSGREAGRTAGSEPVNQGSNPCPAA